MALLTDVSSFGELTPRAVPPPSTSTNSRVRTRATTSKSSSRHGTEESSTVSTDEQTGRSVVAELTVRTLPLS